MSSRVFSRPLPHRRTLAGSVAAVGHRPPSPKQPLPVSYHFLALVHHHRSTYTLPPHSLPAPELLLRVHQSPVPTNPAQASPESLTRPGQVTPVPPRPVPPQCVEAKYGPLRQAHRRAQGGIVSGRRPRPVHYLPPAKRGVRPDRSSSQL